MLMNYQMTSLMDGLEDDDGGETEFGDEDNDVGGEPYLENICDMPIDEAVNMVMQD